MITDSALLTVAVISFSSGPTAGFHWQGDDKIM